MDRRSNRGRRRSDVRGRGRSRAGHRGSPRGQPHRRRRIVRARKRRVPRTGLAAPRARTGLAVVENRFAGREPGVARRGNVLRGAGGDLAPSVAGRAARRGSGRGLVAKDGSLEHLDISVSDLERSGAFWAAFLKDLGYREFAKSATGWSWTNDESTIFLLQAESGYLDPPYHRKRVGLNHLAFGVSDRKQVDAMATRLRERNIPLLYGGPRTGRTTYAVFFEDPDRIKIEVVAPLVARAVPAPARVGGQGGVAGGRGRRRRVISDPLPRRSSGGGAQPVAAGGSLSDPQYPADPTWVAGRGVVSRTRGAPGRCCGVRSAAAGGVGDRGAGPFR